MLIAITLISTSNRYAMCDGAEWLGSVSSQIRRMRELAESISMSRDIAQGRQLQGYGSRTQSPLTDIVSNAWDTTDSATS